MEIRFPAIFIFKINCIAFYVITLKPKTVLDVYYTTIVDSMRYTVDGIPIQQPIGA